MVKDKTAKAPTSLTSKQPIPLTSATSKEPKALTSVTSKEPKALTSVTSKEPKALTSVTSKESAALTSVTLESTIEENKGLLESKVFWGVLVMVFASFSRQWFGVDIDELTESAITEDLLTAVGALLAIWGRIAAVKKIDNLA